MKIVINDERITQILPVSLEDIKCDITESKPQTFLVLEVDKEVEKTLEIVQPAYQTTLKDIDADISNLEIQLSQANDSMAKLTLELTKKQNMKIELGAVVQVAFDDLQVAISKKPVGKEIIP